MNKFPIGAPDRTIFEASPGVYYQYNAQENSWIRVDKFNVNPATATPLRDGLMTSEDLSKLDGLMLPPPKTSLTTDGCRYVFNNGTFGFRSSLNHLIIETELSLIDKDEKGFDLEQKRVWKIHENTYGVNFRLNLAKLVTELESRDHLTYRKTIGPQGPKGDKGTDGIDRLETGPKGKKGTDGKNSPYDGFLSTETEGFLSGDGSRGIVSISTERISSEENYLIITRANIGNPDLCPKFVTPKDIDSKWILVVDERAPVRQIVEDCPEDICGVSTCEPRSISSVIRSFCSTRLYFLDMSPIETEIRSRFDSLLLELKRTKEAVTNELLKSMIDLFSEQKLALCCAIENCESRRENQRHRNLIDSERIQAAQAGFSIYVDGDDKRNYVDTNPGKDCPEDEEALAIEEPVTSTDISVDPCTRFNISCGNQNLDEAASMWLEAGHYSAEITTCCCFTGVSMTMANFEAGKTNPASISSSIKDVFDKMTPYNGRAIFSYRSTSGDKTVTVPNKGYFRDGAAAATAYSTFTFDFEHAGGYIKAYYDGAQTERDRFKEILGSLPPPPQLAQVDQVRQEYENYSNEELQSAFAKLQAQWDALEAQRRGLTTAGAPAGQVRQINLVISRIKTVLSLVNIRMISLSVPKPSAEEIAAARVEIGFIEQSVSDLQVRSSDEGTMEFCFKRLDPPVITSIPIPSTGEAGTEQDRVECDPDYETNVSIDASVNSVQITADSNVIIDENPREFSSLGSDIDQTGNFVDITLPSSGTFEIEILGGSFYVAKIIDGDFGRFCPKGCTVKERKSGALAIARPNDRIYPDWEVQPNADGIMPEIEDKFVSGFLVTKEMYDAAIANDAKAFYAAIITSGSVVTDSDPAYKGLQNSRVPNEVDIDTEALMRDVQKKIRGHIGTITVLYNGYVTENSLEPTDIIQSVGNAGFYYTSEESVIAYSGKKIKLSVADPRIRLFYNVPNYFGGLVQPEVSPNNGKVQLSVKCVYEKVIDCTPVFNARLNCLLRTSEIKAQIYTLPAGDYVLSTTECCCFDADGYSSRVAIRYKSPDGQKDLFTPDFGGFPNKTDADNHYIGNTVSFSHIGGIIKVWVPKASQRSGIVGIKIEKKECFDLVTEPAETTITGTSITTGTEEIIGFIPCDMPLEHLNFYEAGWKSGACCGAYVEESGVKWIVVLRSIGADTTCGGGESPVTECISNGLDIGIHPAVAFPSLDGQNFFGKPTGGFQRFFRDVGLEGRILGKIVANEVIKSVNNPGPNITAIIFPYEA